MLSHIIFGIYNLIYQVFIICFLFYANTFLNFFFIPDSFMWKDGKPREDTLYWTITQTAILIIEAVLLIFLIYFVNKWFLSNVEKLSNSNSIAIWTSGINVFITLTFIIYFIYVVSQ